MKKELTQEEKEEKRKKRKEKKLADEKKETVTVDGKEQVFIDKHGHEIKLLEFLKPEEIWDVESKRVSDDKITIVKRHFILYDGIKRLGREAGIFYSDKIQVYAPTIENKDLYGFDVTVYCSAGSGDVLPDPKGNFECIHGYFKTSMLGEANNENTKRLSGKYKGLTAEKRGYVRAVINHLGLKNIYGEDELDEEKTENPSDESISRPDFEALREVLSKLLNAEDKDSLVLVGESINVDKEKFSKEQIEYLRLVFNKKMATLEKTNF